MKVDVCSLYCFFHLTVYLININIHLCTDLTRMCHYTSCASAELHCITSSLKHSRFGELPERKSFLVASPAAFIALSSLVDRTVGHFSGF